MEGLKTLKESLMACALSQMNNLGSVDAKELGEVVDMVKDLAETEYYCAITEAMEDKSRVKEKEKEYHYYTERPIYYNDRSYYMDYNNGRGYYTEPGVRHYGEREYQMGMRDYREGRSPSSRKMYMEAKEMHQPKEKQMKELEKYMQELSKDITEMIGDATHEEKEYLEHKLITLAEKLHV